MKDQNKITLIYEATPEEQGGYSVVCLNWPGSGYTQGEDFEDAKRMAAEATEIGLDLYQANELHQSRKPDFETDYLVTNYRFQLSFDLETGKHLE